MTKPSTVSWNKTVEWMNLCEQLLASIASNITALTSSPFLKQTEAISLSNNSSALVSIGNPPFDGQETNLWHIYLGHVQLQATGLISSLTHIHS